MLTNPIFFMILIVFAMTVYECRFVLLFVDVMLLYIRLDMFTRVFDMFMGLVWLSSMATALRQPRRKQAPGCLEHVPRVFLLRVWVHKVSTRFWEFKSIPYLCHHVSSLNKFYRILS